MTKSVGKTAILAKKRYSLNPNFGMKEACRLTFDSIAANELDLRFHKITRNLIVPQFFMVKSRDKVSSFLEIAKLKIRFCNAYCEASQKNHRL